MGPPLDPGARGPDTTTESKGKVPTDDDADRRREVPMSFRELTMTDVREVLRRLAAGQTARHIARDGVADRKTVGRYAEAARTCGFEAGTELDDAFVARVAELVQRRPDLPPSEPWSALLERRATIESWIGGERPLRLVRVQELLAREGVEVAYSTLRRFVRAEFGWREPPVTMRLDDPPFGQEAQVDFGHMGFLEVDGVKKKLWALVVTLSASRYMFVWPTLLQTTEALCAGLDAAWRFFGGVPARIVPDNMSAAIVKPDAQEPTVQRAFLEYAQHCGFFVDPARVRRPQDKGRVENTIAYVRERCFDGEHFLTLGDAQEHAERWCRDVAGTRVHGTTKLVPGEVYARDEKPAMRPVPETVFDVPTWTKAKVHPDHHVQVAKALYSAPTAFIGHRLEVRVDRRSVKLYEGAVLVKAHPRVAAGKRSTDTRDYPVGKQIYADRSIEAHLARSRAKGPHVEQFVAKLLDVSLPWTRLRSVQGLLRLCERYGAERVDALCRSALAFDVLDVKRIDGMLRSAQHAEERPSAEGRVVRLPVGRFARDASAFVTRAPGGEKAGTP
jgi:transposase